MIQLNSRALSQRRHFGRLSRAFPPLIVIGPCFRNRPLAGGSFSSTRQGAASHRLLVQLARASIAATWVMRDCAVLGVTSLPASGACAAGAARLAEVRVNGAGLVAGRVLWPNSWPERLHSSLRESKMAFQSTYGKVWLHKRSFSSMAKCIFSC